MDKAWDYNIQDDNFFEFAIKLILGALLTPIWLLILPFRNSFGPI